MKTQSDISTAVGRLYDTFPFPPDPLSDEPPPGYNWRWCWPIAYQFCTGQKPSVQNIRILDAGCGTGSSTDYLIYLNPEASVVAIDLSSRALEIAQQRCLRSGVIQPTSPRAQFHNISLYDVHKLEGEFNLINCVGVLHHLPDPKRGIQSLALKLAPGGIMHIFVYAELGRREIQLMQNAIAILQGDQRDDYTDGVKIGRKLFATLPENNPLVQYEKEHWALENQRDECFADMYVHPQEIDYNIETLFELIEASGLEFLGFSNPDYWQLERLLGQDEELWERAKNLNDRERYRLIELLDPQITHYEFFLGRPPRLKNNWSDDRVLLQAQPELSPCIYGWPSQQIMGYNYQMINLSPEEFAFLQATETANKTVGEILNEVKLGLDGVRALHHQQLILLTPNYQ